MPWKQLLACMLALLSTKTVHPDHFELVHCQALHQRHQKAAHCCSPLFSDPSELSSHMQATPATFPTYIDDCNPPTRPLKTPPLWYRCMSTLTAPCGACCFSTGTAAVTAAGAQQLTSTAARFALPCSCWNATTRGCLSRRQAAVLSSRVNDTHTGLSASRAARHTCQTGAVINVEDMQWTH